jgi:hypothetical protein
LDFDVPRSETSFAGELHYQFGPTVQARRGFPLLSYLQSIVIGDGPSVEVNDDLCGWGLTVVA